MSTPALAALDGSNAGAAPAPVGTNLPGAGAGGGAGSTPVVPGGAGGAPATAPGAGGAAANQPFWSGWTDPADKDVRDFAANKNFPDIKAAIKSQRELETNVATLRAAANLKAYPTATTNPDGTVKPADALALKAWDTTMGVPESPDKYDLAMPADSAYPQFKTYLADELHKAHVPASMANQLSKGYEAAVTRMLTELKTEENTRSAATLLELERDWGANYKERVAFAARGKEWLAKEAGGLDDLQLRSMESSMGTAKFMTAMWKMGMGNREASYAGGTNQPGTFGNSAATAQVELDQIMADRTANKITDFQWRTVSSKRVDELRDIIVGGMATQ